MASRNYTLHRLAAFCICTVTWLAAIGVEAHSVAAAWPSTTDFLARLLKPISMALSLVFYAPFLVVCLLENNAKARIAWLVVAAVLASSPFLFLGDERTDFPIDLTIQLLHLFLMPVLAGATVLYLVSRKGSSA